MAQKDLAVMRRQPFNSMLDVLKSVESGAVDFGFIPIENMIEGAVTSSLDAIAFGTGLLIQREVTMDVSLMLMVLPGTKLSEVNYVRSYPVAYAQCGTFLHRRLPGVKMVAANSTAEAARDLGASGRMDTAVIAPRRAAQVYGLEVLAEGIEDRTGNKTRFALVGAKPVRRRPGGTRPAWSCINALTRRDQWWASSVNSSPGPSISPVCRAARLRRVLEATTS